jgi:hypothetical protein
MPSPAPTMPSPAPAMPYSASSNLSTAAVGGIIAGSLVIVLLLLAFFFLKHRRAFKRFTGRCQDAGFVVGAPSHPHTREEGNEHVVLSIPDPASTYARATQEHAFSKLAQELAQAQAHLRWAGVTPPSDAEDPRVTLDLLQNRLREILGLIAEQQAQAGILPGRETRSAAGVLSDGSMREALPAYDARGFVGAELHPK